MCIFSVIPNLKAHFMETGIQPLRWQEQQAAFFTEVLYMNSDNKY